jgi:myosin heavy subunit
MREITDMLICEDFFENKKDVLLSVRLPRDLLEALKDQAEERDQRLPDLVRSHLAYHTLADQLRNMVAEGMPLQEEDRSLLDDLRNYTEDILKVCKGVQIVRRHARELKKLSSKMEALVESKTREAVNRRVAELKSEFERNEQRRQKQRKQKRAAGLLEPGPPLELSEDQKANLTESQRKQRRSLGWDLND